MWALATIFGSTISRLQRQSITILMIYTIGLIRFLDTILLLISASKSRRQVKTE